MTHYCTYFDSNYLPQGVALLESLRRHDPSGVLWVLALDERAERLLGQLALPGLRCIPLDKLLMKDLELARVRHGRSRREFIFTVTPCWIGTLLNDNPEIERVAYVDADMWFFGAPAAAWLELGDSSVLVVPHRYPPWHDDAPSYGTFNVGWLVFRNDSRALACLDRWRKQCLSSCALEGDKGAFGDQKYLDDWPKLLGSGLAISRHPGVNLAPWNWSGFECRVSSCGVQVAGHPLLLFHFAQFRRVSRNWWDSGQLEFGIMPEPLRTAVYGPYVDALEAAVQTLRTVDPTFEMKACGWTEALGSWHLAALRLTWGQFWFRTSNGRLSSGRLGLGRWSGHFMGAYRRWKRRR